MGFDVGQQSRSGGVFTRAAQAQQVLQVEEGQHLVLLTRGQVAGHIGPAVSHVHTCQLQPHQ